MSATERPSPDHRDTNIWALAYTVAATYFLEYLSTTIVATALPEMARSFAVEPNEVSLGMTAYMLTLAVFIPISGWAADRFGSRTIFGCALLVFLLGSILSGMSTGVGFFTAARVIQGVGGSLMVPVGRMIVVRNADKSEVMWAVSTIIWPAIVAPVVGPTIGGFLTTYVSWRWAFFINIPLGIAAMLAILRFVPNQRGVVTGPPDLKGFLLSGAALIGVLYGTELASHERASVLEATAFMATGIAAGVASLVHLRRVSNPLIDLSSLRLQTYAATVSWGSAARIGIDAVPYLSPLLFQIGFGLSAFQSGLLLLATAVGNLGMKAFTTPILRHFGFRAVLIVNGLIAMVSIGACGWLSPVTPLVIMVTILFAYGAARSLQYTALATLAYADVSDVQKGPASTLWTVAQQMTMGMGIAFGALCLRISSYLGNDGPIETDHYLVSDFRWAFVAASLPVLVAVIGFVRLPLTAGDGISGRQSRPYRG